MATRFLMIAASLLCPLVAQAQTQVLLINQTLVDNEFIFGTTAGSPPTLSQRVLNATNPSLIGLGWSRSVIRCDDAAVTGYFVTVENFGSGTATDGRYALVSGVMLDGMEVNMPATLYGSEEEIDLSDFGATLDSDGIHLDGEFPTITDVRVERFRGIGITTRTGGALIRGVHAKQNHSGIRLAPSDSAVADSFCHGNRDAGLWVAANAGNCQASQTHCYGQRIACYNEGGQGFRAQNCTFADSTIGYLGHTRGGGSALCSLSNILFQKNWCRNAIFRSPQVTLTNCQILVQPRVAESEFKAAETGSQHNNVPDLPDYDGLVGIDIQARHVDILGGYIMLAPTTFGYQGTNPMVGAEAVWIRSPDFGTGLGGNSCRINSQLIDNDGYNGSIGIRVSIDLLRESVRYGIRVDCEIGSGWTQSNDRVLIVDSNVVMKDCQFVLRGTQSDLISNPGKYVDLPDDWNGAGDNFANSVTLIKSDSGEILELDGQTEY